MESNKYPVPLLQLVIRGILLIIAAFIINYLAYYLWELLRSSQLPYIHKYSLMGGLGAAWAIINLFLIVAAITKRFWSDPDLFTFRKKITTILKKRVTFIWNVALFLFSF